MKLKSYNRSNTGDRSGMTPKLTIGAKGLFTFNRAANQTIGLSQGDKVEILQDEDRTKDWYVRKTEEASGFEPREAKQGALLFTSTGLATVIVDSLGLERGKTYKMAIGPERDGGGDFRNNHGFGSIIQAA